MGGLYNEYTKVGTGKSEVLVGTAGDDELDGGPGFDRAAGDEGNDACVNAERVFGCELDALGALTG